MEAKFFIDVHVSPTGIIKLINDGGVKTIVKTYVGNSKWKNFSKEELDDLILEGITKEVDKATAKEFIDDFDKLISDKL